MEIKIKRSHKTIKDKLPEAGVSDELYRKVVKITQKLKRSDLLLFWLKDSAQRSEKEFDTSLSYMPKFSKQEIVDIMAELGKKTLVKFVKEFSK